MPVLTLANLVSRVYAQLDGNTQLYSQTEVINYTNEAIRILNLATAFLQTTVPLPGWSVANRIWYPVPSGILLPTRISFEGKPLQPISLDKLGQAYPRWTSATTLLSGMPVMYWIRRGVDRFGIWPADAYGGAQIMVTGVQQPALLVNLTDAVTMNNDVLLAFDAYVSHVLQLKESTEDFAQSSSAYQEFQRIIKRVGAWQGLKMPRYWIEQAEQE